MSCLFAARLARMAEITVIDPWPEAIHSIQEHGILYEDTQGEDQSGQLIPRRIIHPAYCCLHAERLTARPSGRSGVRLVIYVG